MLELREIALKISLQPYLQVLSGDLAQHRGGCPDRLHHRVQRVVDAFDDLAVIALMLAGVGARAELAFHRRLSQQPRLGRQRDDVILQQHQPLVNLILVGRPGDRRRHVAVGDLRDKCHQIAQPADHHVQVVLDQVEIAGVFFGDLGRDDPL